MATLTLNKGSRRGSLVQETPSTPEVPGAPLQLEQQIQLHRGRHSVVWAGYCAALKQPLVLKIYEKEKMKHRHILNAYREICILQGYAQQGYPGVVGLVAHWEDDSHISLLFEQCSGGDLFQLLVKHGSKLPEAYVCCQVVVPLLTTLQDLHGKNIVHRDIKPENIFLTSGGLLKLGDFGLAVCLNTDRAIARVGTLDYMAPEVLSMPTPEELTARESNSGIPAVSGYGCKVDIWALGVLVFELLAGKPPFEVEDAAATTRLIQSGAAAAFPDDMSITCRDFIAQALQQDPEHRPSASELLKHPWVEAQQEAGPSNLSMLSESWGSSDWSLKAAYLRSLSIGQKSISLDATPPTSPGRRDSNSSQPGYSSACSSPRLAWKQTADSPLKKSTLTPCKSRFSRSNSMSSHCG